MAFRMCQGAATQVTFDAISVPVLGSVSGEERGIALVLLETKSQSSLKRQSKESHRMLVMTNHNCGSTFVSLVFCRVILDLLAIVVSTYYSHRPTHSLDG